MLLSKHGMRISVRYENVLYDLANCLRTADNQHLLSLLEEIARTTRDLRSRITPKYSHDERFADLSRCLQLDGYLLKDSVLTQTDPSIADMPAVDDDLIEVLNTSNLLEKKDIIERINTSSESFRATPPNYNACLNDVRVALETLARNIASTQQQSGSPDYDETKWGSVLNFLKVTSFITQEEERGLAGVYGFVSPGSHRSLGISEEAMARLGRSLALSMCWFLIRSYRTAQ